MAKSSSSSSKKVARVARAGSGKRRVRERPKLAFPLGIFVIVVLGSLTVFYARTSRFNSAAASEAPVANQDHWHNAYGFYVCDHFLPPFTDQGDDKNGIHTHGDGIIHIHPFVASSAGGNAQLKIFANQVGMKLGKDSITTPDGTEYKSGDYQCNGKPAKVYVYRWSAAEDPTVPAEVFDHDFGDVRLKDDKGAITFAVVPEGTDVPRPDSIPTLNNLSDVGSTAAGAAAGAAGASGAGSPTDSIPISIPPDAGGAIPSVTVAPGAAGATPSVSEAVPSTPAPSTPASTP